MERQLQCVLPSAGSVSSVLRSSTMTSSSSMERGFPGLRSSYRPMRPWVRKRSRHLPTVWRLVPTSSATALLSNPSAHRSTILARLTSPAARLRERERDSSSSRVLPLTSSGFNGRPRSMASPSSEWMRGNILYSCHYVHVFTGHDTRRQLHQSGRPDSNRGPPAPKAGALPSCATPRKMFGYHTLCELANVSVAPNCAKFCLVSDMELSVVRPQDNRGGTRSKGGATRPGEPLLVFALLQCQ